METNQNITPATYLTLSRRQRIAFLNTLTVEEEAEFLTTVYPAPAGPERSELVG